MTPTLLILRALGLGDALAAVPALRGLRHLHPDHRLVLAAPEPLGAWQRQLGLVDDVLPTTGLGTSLHGADAPDVAVNLHGRGPRSHRMLQALKPGRLIAFAAPEAGHHGPPWPARTHEVDRWCALVDAVGGRCEPTDLLLGARRPPVPGAPVIVHPGAAAPSRRWPLPRWRAVAGHLARAGHRVVVTGSRDEASLCGAVAADQPGVEDASGRYDLPALSEVVAGARLCLSGDTGTAHLATAHAVPSVVLFGPVPPSLWGPRTDHDRHLVLWRPRTGDAQGDPHGARLDERLARITVDDVVAAAEDLLSHTDGPAPSAALSGSREQGEGGGSPALPAPPRRG